MNAYDKLGTAAGHGRSCAAPGRRAMRLRRGGLSRNVLASNRTYRIYNFYAICFASEKW
jgi:hypothetical protein